MHYAKCTLNSPSSCKFSSNGTADTSDNFLAIQDAPDVLTEAVVCNDGLTEDASDPVSLLLLFTVLSVTSIVCPVNCVVLTDSKCGCFNLPINLVTYLTATLSFTICKKQIQVSREFHRRRFCGVLWHSAFIKLRTSLLFQKITLSLVDFLFFLHILLSEKTNLCSSP